MRNEGECSGLMGVLCIGNGTTVLENYRDQKLQGDCCDDKTAPRSREVSSERSTQPYSSKRSTLPGVSWLYCALRVRKKRFKMKLSTWFIFAFIAACALRLTTSFKATRPPKVKKPKPMDWINSYYTEKYLPCKKMRIFDPVETVRAQAWATTFFRKCGPKFVVEYATKYNFPAYGKCLENVP